jgi:hypothetical protein
MTVVEGDAGTYSPSGIVMHRCPCFKVDQAISAVDSGEETGQLVSFVVVYGGPPHHVLGQNRGKAESIPRIHAETNGGGWHALEQGTAPHGHLTALTMAEPARSRQFPYPALMYPRYRTPPGGATWG